MSEADEARAAEDLPFEAPRRQGTIGLAAAFRWAARLNPHEAEANYFSLFTSDGGTELRIDPTSGASPGLAPATC